MFQRIMRGLVDTGRAPHHAELARALGLGVEEGRVLLHDVLRPYPIGWLHPERDYIASFPPLNNVPIQYRITVRGTQIGTSSATARPGVLPATALESVVREIRTLRSFGGRRPRLDGTGPPPTS